MSFLSFIFGRGDLAATTYQDVLSSLNVGSLAYRKLTDEDVTRSESLRQESELQHQRALSYCSNIRQAVLSEANAQAEFVRQFGGLKSAVQYTLESAALEAKSEEETYRGKLAAARDTLKRTFAESRKAALPPARGKR
jgi:hypothetical protein